MAANKQKKMSIKGLTFDTADLKNPAKLALLLQESVIEPNYVLPLCGTPILLLMWDNTECLRIMIRAGANPHVVDARGRNILHLLALSRNTRTGSLKFFIDLGVNMELRTVHGYTPLQCALLFGGNLDNIRCLVESGACCAGVDSISMIKEARRRLAQCRSVCIATQRAVFHRYGRQKFRDVSTLIVSMIWATRWN